MQSCHTLPTLSLHPVPAPPRPHLCTLPRPLLHPVLAGPFERFLGHAKLPRGNPLALQPGYGQASEALAAVLNTGDSGAFAGVPNPGAFLAILLNEVPPLAQLLHQMTPALGTHAVRLT